jgi:predicted secreted protein
MTNEDILAPPLFRFEVHTYTICEGWINCWTVSEGDVSPYSDSFPTIAEAIGEIEALITDVQSEINAGWREPDDAYDTEDYRVYDNMDQEYVA